MIWKCVNSLGILQAKLETFAFRHSQKYFQPMRRPTDPQTQTASISCDIDPVAFANKVKKGKRVMPVLAELGVDGIGLHLPGITLL